MESFELGKELEKDVFRLVTRVRHIKYSKSPWGIEPQTFGFCAPMLYYWATDTVSEVYYEVHSPKLAISLIISKNNTLWTHADPSSVQDGVSCIWELHNRSRLRWNLCGSVVAHRSAESEGLRFDSLWRLRIFFSVPRSWQDEKSFSTSNNVSDNLKESTYKKFTSWLAH